MRAGPRRQLTKCAEPRAREGFSETEGPSGGSVCTPDLEIALEGVAESEQSAVDARERTEQLRADLHVQPLSARFRSVAPPEGAACPQDDTPSRVHEAVGSGALWPRNEILHSPRPGVRAVRPPELGSRCLVRAGQ